MSQLQLTDFYKSGKSYGEEMEHKKFKRRNVSLHTSTPKRKIEFDNDKDVENLVIVLSSDEETEKKLCLKTDILSQNSFSSNCSDKTIIYSLENESVIKNIAVKQEVFAENQLKTNCNKSSSSPQLSSSSSGSYQTPVKKSKHYSPNKKRNVKIKSPKTPKISSFFSPTRRLFENEDFSKCFEGLDDKTTFLLKIINDFLKEDSLKKLLMDTSKNLLSDCLSLPKPGMKLVCRLFWRKDGWHKKDEILKICAEEKGDMMDTTTATSMLIALVNKNILLEGSRENITFQEFTKILNAEELKNICKFFKLKKQTKKSAIEALEEFCKNIIPISNYFISTGIANNPVDNSRRVTEIMCQKVGKCYRLSDLARSTLERLYILTYLGIDFEVIREKRLEFMLINNKIQRETFPINHNMKLDNASVVFANKDEFDRYFTAHRLYEDFILLVNDKNSKTEEICAIVRKVYDLYKNIDVQHLIRYKSLPIWLQRYTPIVIYIKLLDSGLQELKKGKDQHKCLLVVEILTSLLEQTFREHKKAQWFAEKALVLHSYLNEPQKAAEVLIEGFESNLSEVSKDCMRPRAMKIAQQKNIKLDEYIQKTLLAFASKESILEGSIPSRHFYKQPMDNPTKGKALYETKNEFGRTTQGVEDYALTRYTSSEGYTNGCHWEGRIIITIYFLLFWDIIYSKPKRCPGIFLSYYQKYPLDLFCEEFYTNRKDAIENRLKLIEESSKDQVLLLLQTEWNNRPECELSPVSLDIGFNNVSSVCECLRPGQIAAICRRLATDYRYSHSGFPDLTLWNVHTKQIKFVEVKSDMDKPSIKQIQWMQYLLEHGVEVEFCYVGAHTTRPKSRRPLKSSVT